MAQLVAGEGVLPMQETPRIPIIEMNHAPNADFALLDDMPHRRQPLIRLLAIV
jgi:hypothetical protein